MTALYGATLCLSAGLLFAIQPMIAKAVLPSLGGSPAVWTTCLAFFQTALLAGYGYAALLAGRLATRQQVVIHLTLLVVAALVFVEPRVGASSPLLPGSPPDELPSPAGWLLATLVERDAVALVLLAASAPLLQGWFAAGRGRDPYFLYAASNAGSLLALLAYPAVIEPRFSLPRQADLWRYGFLALLGMVALCGVVVAVRPRAALPVKPASEPPRPAAWLRWAVLAAVPSSLLLGLTQFVTQDLAAVPLLWVIPLAIYLLTYIAAFARRPWFPLGFVARLYPLVLMALGPALAAGLVRPWWLWLPLHLLAFTLAALSLHGALARSRPPAGYLTHFYLALAAGGAAGGAFNALIAPVVFDRPAEYPLMLVVAAILVARVKTREEPRPWRMSDLLLPAGLFVLIAPLARNLGGVADGALGGLAIALASGLLTLACVRHRSRPVQFALSFGAVIAACGLWPGRDGQTLLRHRDFYGTLRVTRDDRARCIRLFHGSTLHGEQSLDPALRREPRAYFDRSGPAGDVFGSSDERHTSGRVAVVGLGCGTLAAYARPSETWSFFELDPAIIQVARDPRYFTYLADCRAASLVFVPGDARLRLAGQPDGSLNLLVLDAFGSDSVPVHLVTREALALYRNKLVPDGLLVFNLTNRYLDLEPVVAALARDAGLICRIRYDTGISRAEVERTGKQPTIWAVMAGSRAALGALADDPRWKPARIDPRIPAWTDESSNLFRSLIFTDRSGHRSADGDTTATPQ